MAFNVEQSRRSLLDLLERTRLETRRILSALDPDRVVHDDERAWRVRDVLGHLAVWNIEAARSLNAFARGEEYICIDSSRRDYDYNGSAANERSQWTLDELWAEYEASHDQLNAAIKTLPAHQWDSPMLFPWNERGTAAQLVQVMMNHEKVDHCELILRAPAS